MNQADRVKLLFGPYRTPALKRGDRVTRLVLDCEVVITSWTDGRIPWPRCRPVGRRSGPAILVDEELARAVRQESAAAVRYWWGICGTTIVKWRKALDVNRTNSPGSRRLIHASAERGGAAFRERGFTEEERERFRQRSRERNTGLVFRKFLEGGFPVWTAEEEALLGTAPDEVIARRIGRTYAAVRTKRKRLRIPAASPS